MTTTGSRIVEIALEHGATAAGIASTADLRRQAPSSRAYREMGPFGGIGISAAAENRAGDWLPGRPRQELQSLLVLCLAHPADRPELDWFDNGGTAGNRRLLEIVKEVRGRVERELGLKTGKLHYHVEKGGVFLKDAAVIAGLGTVGNNNLLVTPTHGPRVRLRAFLIDAVFDSSGPVGFDPCGDCAQYCRQVCPEQALERPAPLPEGTAVLPLPARDGRFDRISCNRRMERDIRDSKEQTAASSGPIAYCRRCEFACPVGSES